MIFEPTHLDVTDDGGVPRVRIEWRDPEYGLHFAVFVMHGNDDVDLLDGDLPEDTEEAQELHDLAADALREAWNSDDKRNPGFSRCLTVRLSLSEQEEVASQSPAGLSRDRLHCIRASVVARTVACYLGLLAEPVKRLVALVDEYETGLAQLGITALPLEVEAHLSSFNEHLREARHLGRQMTSALWKTATYDNEGKWVAGSAERVLDWVYCATLLICGWSQTKVARERERMHGGPGTAKEWTAHMVHVGRVDKGLRGVARRGSPAAAVKAALVNSPTFEAALARTVPDERQREHTRLYVLALQMAPEVGRAFGLPPSAKERAAAQAARTSSSTTRASSSYSATTNRGERRGKAARRQR